MKRIVPAIMSIDPFSLAEHLGELDSLGLECLHADVMDGVFAPYVSHGSGYYEAIAKRSCLPLEIHFQVEDPMKHIKQTDVALFERVIVHTERLSGVEVDELIQKVSLCKVGIAINPSTDLDQLSRFIGHDRIDKFVLMATEPGSPAFNKGIFERVRKLREVVRSTKRIQIDGGVRRSNIAALSSFGADEFVCGSALFTGGRDICTNHSNLIQELECTHDD